MVQMRLNLTSVLWYKCAFFFSVCVRVFVMFEFLQDNLNLNQTLLLSSEIVFFFFVSNGDTFFLYKNFFSYLLI